MICRADPTKYGTLMMELLNQVMKGKDEYPKNMATATSMLELYESTSQQRHNHQWTQDQVWLLQRQRRDRHEHWQCSRQLSDVWAVGPYLHCQLWWGVASQHLLLWMPQLRTLLQRMPWSDNCYQDDYHQHRNETHTVWFYVGSVHRQRHWPQLDTSGLQVNFVCFP